MGVVLPEWADEVLDLIGVSWPNVDEDDFREMGATLREVATTLETNGLEAQQAVNTFLEGSSGPAVDAFSAHWNKVNATHLANLAQAAQLAATAAEIVAYLITAAKIAALIQLAVLAAQLIAAAASAPFTLGLSSLGGAAAVQATRMIVRRLLKEVLQAIIEQVTATALGPVFEGLGAMAGDLAIQGAGHALGTQDGIDLTQTAEAGKQGLGISEGETTMELNSAGAGSGHAGGPRSSPMNYDLDALDELGPKLSKLGEGIRTQSGSQLDLTKKRQGRTRGKDELANAANTGLDKAIDGIETGVKKLSSHIEKVVPNGLKKMSQGHRDNDKDVAHSLDALAKRDNGTPMYLMADDGSIRRLRSDGTTADLTSEDKARIGLQSSSMVRPPPGDPLVVRPKGVAQTDRPTTNSTQVPFGSTDLARATQLARHSDESYGTRRKGRFQSNNYAAIDVDSAHGDGKFILVGRSKFPTHSEPKLGYPFLRDGEEGRINRLYTEREPCTSGRRCTSWLAERLPDVEVSYSTEYGEGESRKRGNKNMEAYLSNLISTRR